MIYSIARISLVLSAVGQALAAPYAIADTFQGESFFDGFDFQSMPDPTHGLVEYVDRATAMSEGLASVSGDTITLRADSTTTLSNGEGRKSFRIQSKQQWNRHVSVYNVQHMPEGCGTWPAIWENGNNWPSGGEIDIVEGVNNAGTSNQITLHTGPDCTMPLLRPMVGFALGSDCSAATNSNEGCPVSVSKLSSYGPSFNYNGGGFYAMERTDQFIKVWYWSRSSWDTPEDVLNGANTINTDAWGMPDAYFASTTCDIGAKFGPANIIINLTFCGDWAGTAYGFSGCPGTCNDFVSENPDAFQNAHFEFNWIKVYQ